MAESQPGAGHLNASIVDHLLSRINDLSNAISPPVDTESEVRRIFNRENVQRANNNVLPSTRQTSEAHVRPTGAQSSAGVYTQRRCTAPQRNFVARRQFQGQRSAFKARRQRKDSSKAKVLDNRPFIRDLVLLSGPNDVIVPRQGARLMLMEHGHVVSGCRFTKAMNSAQVELAIIEALSEKIPAGVDIELLVSMHTSLVVPSLAPGHNGIDGAILQRLYQNKPIYIRPSQQLIASQQVNVLLFLHD